MSESLHNDNPMEAVTLATEEVQETLRSGEIDPLLVERYGTLERSMFAAGQQGAISIQEGLTLLSGIARTSHEACVTSTYSEGETFFMSKFESYKLMLEALAAKPVAEPRQTDTSARSMSGAKDRI